MNFELDGRMRSLIEAIGPEPMSLSAIYHRAGLGKMGRNGSKRNMRDRLLLLDGRFGIQSVEVNGCRLWKRETMLQTSFTTPDPLGAVGVCHNGKWAYPTEAVAKAALRHVRGSIHKNRRRNQKVPKRAYECPWCSMWHLTSKEEQCET